MDGTEAGIVKAAAAGDERAFEYIVRAHGAHVYNLAYRIVTDAHEAEDVTQEVFATAFASLPRFRGESKLSTWLYRIAVNRARYHLARRKAPPAALDDCERTAPDGGARAEAADAAGKALALLPDEWRPAVVLHSMYGYTYEEAADILGIPSGTVKTYVHRGMKVLREAFLEDAP